MAQDQSVQTMLQGALVPVDKPNGVYAMQVSGATSGSQGVPIETSIPVAARVTSIYLTGKQSAPAAGTTIITTAALASGTYEINISAFIGGTTVATLEVDNMELFVNGVSQGRIINAVAGTAGASDVARLRFKYDGNGIIAIKANAAATAGSIYVATIVATRIN